MPSYLLALAPRSCHSALEKRKTDDVRPFQDRSAVLRPVLRFGPLDDKAACGISFPLLRTEFLQAAPAALLKESCFPTTLSRGAFMHIAASGAAALILALSCSVMPALAMPGAGDGMTVRPSDPAERFDQMDTNHDKSLSWEELSAARPNLSRNAFDIIDTSRNGTISLDEWKAFSAGHGGSMSMPDMSEMMKAMRGAGDGGKVMPSEGGMPLIMPPSKNDAVAPAPEKSVKSGSGMLLITPPAEAK